MGGLHSVGVDGNLLRYNDISSYDAKHLQWQNNILAL